MRVTIETQALHRHASSKVEVRAAILTAGKRGGTGATKQRLTRFNQVTGTAGRGEEGGAILRDEGGGRKLRRGGQGREGKARQGKTRLGKEHQAQGPGKERTWQRRGDERAGRKPTPFRFEASDDMGVARIGGA